MDKVLNNFSFSYANKEAEERYEQLDIIGVDAYRNLRDLFFQSERAGSEQEEVLLTSSCLYVESVPFRPSSFHKELIAFYPAFLANIYTPQAEALLKDLGNYFQKHIIPYLH